MPAPSSFADLAWWAVAALPLVALALTVVNVLTWTRGRRDAPPLDARTSVLIPARNEAANIEACVRAVAREANDLLEIVVYDDGSTDDTGAILARLAGELPKLRVEQGIGLPDGWVGKPHACHQLARHARGDLLLWLDADVVLEPGGVRRIHSLFVDGRADAVTAVPRQITGSPFERMILPLLHFTYTSWLPLALIPRVRDPRVLAANGQILAIRRAAYDTIGGFASVAAEVVDDMAITRRLKATGHRVVFADAHLIARCRMYRSARDVWKGFSKNLYEGTGASPVGLLGLIALYSAAFILPWLALPALPWLPDAATLPVIVAFGANVLQRLIGVVRWAHPVDQVLLHPIAVGGLLAIAVNSWRWNARGAIEWAGRTYAPRSRRALPTEVPHG